MLALSEKYGKNKAFEDEELFNEITAMTYPEIGVFFDRYVKGTGPLPADTASAPGQIEPLPFEEIFEKLGIIYAEEHIFEDYSLGIDNPDLGLAQTDSVPKLQIATTAHLNAMGKALGFQEGDILLQINGEPIPDLGSPDPGAFFQRQLLGLSEGDDLSYTVLRRNSDGEAKETILTAAVQKVSLSQKHVLAPNPQATPEQLALRAAWLRTER